MSYCAQQRQPNHVTLGACMHTHACTRKQLGTRRQPVPTHAQLEEKIGHVVTAGEEPQDILEVVSQVYSNALSLMFPQPRRARESVCALLVNLTWLGAVAMPVLQACRLLSCTTSVSELLNGRAAHWGFDFAGS